MALHRALQRMDTPASTEREFPVSVWCAFGKKKGKIALTREHGTRFEMMAILVKALKCATKRLRAFP